MSPVDSACCVLARLFLLPWYAPVVDEAVQGRAFEAHVFAEFHVGDPPFADEAADEALSCAQVLGGLVDGEQLTGVTEGRGVVGGGLGYRFPPSVVPNHVQRPPAG